ncbi:MAG: c-type cytochrome [Segetibacter sp.]|nr:c-type cytochrome [Segetibacter sp.]
MKFQVKKQWFKGVVIAGLLAVFNTNAFAADASTPTGLNNSLAVVLLIVIVGLLLAIGLLAYVVITAGEIYLERFKEKQKEDANAAVKALGFLALCLVSGSVFAADAPTADAAKEVVVTTIGGLSKTTFYALISVLALELVVLFTLLFQLKTFLAKDQPIVEVAEAEAKEAWWITTWNKMNSFKPETEVTDTGHDYDGIKELDNNLPKWWLYGFYVCIVFAFVYIYRFHISHTGPSTLQEFQTEMAKADVEKEEYLKSSANKVDENTVTLLTDAAALAEGKKLFGASCSPCHGADGQGVVGPNLTDEYWLHKGSIKDIFKIIKYGVQEKGMKSWKDDFSPVQLAEISSYIKSLQGTKPAGAKEPQGDLYTEDGKATTETTRAAGQKLAVK